MSFLEKHSFTVTTTSGDYGVSASTLLRYGYIHAIEYRAGATPFIAGSSARVQIRRGSTTGVVLGRTSSGLLGVDKHYEPRIPASGTTSGAYLLTAPSSDGNYLQADRMPVVNDVLYICTKASSSSPTQTGFLDVYIG